MTAAGASPTSSGATAASGLSIGAVLTRLRSEFPDLSISKIRFLEAEELVTPQRTSSGYRQFSRADIDRLRYILTAQRDHYLPLKVIKERLDAIDRGVHPASPARSGLRLPRSLVVADAPESTDLATSREVQMSRSELLADVNFTEAQLKAVETAGLVEPGAHGYYGAEAMLAARTVSELMELGLEPRHLRSLRTTADREAAMLAQLVAAQARQRDPAARERASAEATSNAATLMRLHALLVKAALGRELGA